MASERTGSGGSAPRRRPGLGGRTLRLLAGLVFGTTPVARRSPPSRDGTPKGNQPPEGAGGVAADEQEEMVTPNPSQPPRSLDEAVQRLEEAVERYRAETRRLSDETSRIALVADRLETRLNEITRLLEGVGAPASSEGAGPAEPRFLPNQQGVDLVISAVPGFQELMDAQRGLNALPSVAAAAVHRFQNGEASLEVTLSSPLAAREVVDGLREATGHELAIEEVRPDAHRLRLRFLDRG